jgi:hypothetical protein
MHSSAVLPFTDQFLGVSRSHQASAQQSSNEQIAIFVFVP